MWWTMSLICVKRVDITIRVVEQYIYIGGHFLHLWKLHGLFLACSGIYLDNIPFIYYMMHKTFPLPCTPTPPCFNIHLQYFIYQNEHQFIFSMIELIPGINSQMC